MQQSETISSASKLQIEEAVKTSVTLVPLKVLRPSFRDDLFRHIAVQTVFAGQVIFSEGTYDSQHIYLQAGEVELKYSSGHQESVQATDTSMPLAHQQPRPCTAIAHSDCTLLRVDSDRLDRTLSWSQIADYLLAEIGMQREYDEDIEWMQTVLNSNLFLKAPPVNVEQIFDRLTPMVVDKGEVIIRQGEIGDCCYFIKEGTADVTVKDEQGKNTKVAEIGPGRCFGEDALVFETVRNATISMTSDGVLMRLEKGDFLLLLKEPAVDEATEKEVEASIEKPIYVDVRTEDEYNSGHLAFSANIPLSLLSLKKRLLAQEKLYVLYCDTGRRSVAAAYLLGKQGYNVVALKGGLEGQNLTHNLVQEEGYILRDGELVSGQ